MIIDRKKKFNKSFVKLNRKIQDKFIERLNIFIKNPFDEKLNNHWLKWKYLWLRSIDVTWDFRAIFKEYPNWKYEFIDFIDIWTHSQLYK